MHINFLHNLRDALALTDERFRSLYRPDVETYPVPFFGNIRQARVLTVGANPSATEFIKEREWPSHITTEHLYSRLINYFNYPIQPHDWFMEWRLALQKLDSSYETGDAAHLDLSPRATISMEDAKRRGALKLFENMVETDVEWFFDLLSLCEQVRLIMMAGCLGTRYMDKFVKRLAPRYGYRMEGMVDKSGSGRVGFYYLQTDDRTLPVFFCSVSPSSRDNSWLLTQRVTENSRVLLETLSDDFSNWPLEL